MGISINGISELMLSAQDIANLPDAVINEMLFAGGEQLVKAQQEAIREAGLVKTGQLEKSIAMDKKVKKTRKGRSVSVGPKGKRSDGKKSKANGFIGGIQDHGSPKRHIVGRRWMSKAAEKAATPATDAAEAVFEKYLKSKNV